MENYNQTPPRKSFPGTNVWIGIILFIAGLGMLAYKMGFPLPYWLFTWPMILILLGFVIGLKDNFQNAGSWILLLIGFLFLADQVVGGINAKNFIGPAILIIIGLKIILRPKKCRDLGKEKFTKIQQPSEAVDSDTSAYDSSASTEGEFVQVNSVFGGGKRFIISKNFQGGSVVSFMGGAEINLLQADIKQPVTIDVSNIFGGTKLVIPDNWEVKNEVTAVFGGVDDKRNPATLAPDPGKVLYIKGTCLFGGVEISSY